MTSIFFTFRMLRKINGGLRTEKHKLKTAFNNMDMLRTPAQSVDALLRGLTNDKSQKMDGNFVDDVSIHDKDAYITSINEYFDWIMFKWSILFIVFSTCLARCADFFRFLKTLFDVFHFFQ